MNEDEEIMGFEEGDICNRHGCQGIIEWDYFDVEYDENDNYDNEENWIGVIGRNHYCPECGWHDEEERIPIYD